MNKTSGKPWAAALAFGLGILQIFTLPAKAEPLVQFPTGDAAWTVVLNYRGQGQMPSAPSPVPNRGTASTTGTNSTPAQITKAEMTQVGDKLRSVFTWSNGKTTETWSIKGAGLTITSRSNGGIYVLPPQLGVLASHLEHFDASLFEWVRADMLKGTVSYRGKPCLHYQGMVSQGTQQSSETVNGRHVETPLPEVQMQAWVEKDTLLPVALDSVTELVVFTFQPAPTEPLTMSKPFQNELDRYMGSLALPKPYKSN